MTGKRGGSGGLLPEDRALWDEVKKSIKPLMRPRSAGGKNAASVALPDPSAKVSRAKPPASAPSPAIHEAPKPPPLAKLDRRARGRIARGRVEIDARLDLHGLTLERARSRLVSFLTRAQSHGQGLVLIITGKGASGRGALKHEVPHWLSLPEMRPVVIGFEEAAPHHGGAGALYVRIRRPR